MLNKMYLKIKLSFIALAFLSIACNRTNSTSFDNSIITQSSNIINKQNIDILKPSHKSVKELKKYSQELREVYSKPQSQWPPAKVDQGVEFKEIGNLPPVKFPIDNQFSISRAKLGRELFFDKRMSAGKELSCATCHDPKQAWADAKQTSTGHEGIQLRRNSPSILNNAYNNLLF